MRSSTSGFSISSASRALVVLGILLVVFLAALELSTRVLFPRISRERHRIAADLVTASGLPIKTADGKNTVLLIGNSLLLDGVDRQEIQQRLDGTYQISMLPIENTRYLDWYFGVRRLFQDGARPSFVILTMNARQLLSSATNGDGFARQMMRLTDLREVSRAAGLNTMVTSSYFFANFSEWLGMRAAVRNAVLERWLPDASALVNRFIPKSPPPDPLTARQLEDGVDRLRQLRDICATYGAGFALLIPPSADPKDPEPTLAVKARESGLQVLMPYAPGEMPVEAFSDGFHLNPRGAALFTPRAALAMSTVLPKAR